MESWFESRLPSSPFFPVSPLFFPLPGFFPFVLIRLWRRNKEGKMKLKALGLILSVGLCLGYCATTGAKEAKIYRQNLDTMLGKEKKEVTTMITDWKFQVLDSWAAEDPDADTIKQHNRGAIGFSKSEIQGR